MGQCARNAAMHDETIISAGNFRGDKELTCSCWLTGGSWEGWLERRKRSSRPKGMS